MRTGVGRPGGVVEGDLGQVLGGDAVAQPAEPQRLGDLLREYGAEVLAGGAPHDFVEEEATRDAAGGRILRADGGHGREVLGEADAWHRAIIAGPTGRANGETDKKFW